MPQEVPIDIRKILDFLPHRYPFLLVDKIIEIGENKIVGIKNVTFNEPFFQGHFPSLPIMPGVLQIEAMAQTAGLYVLSKPENRGKMGLFAGIDKARFKRPVVPGDQLRMEITMLKIGRLTSCKGVATVDGELASEAEMKFMLAPEEMLKK